VKFAGFATVGSTENYIDGLLTKYTILLREKPVSMLKIG
jgi:hypothetical protein